MAAAPNNLREFIEGLHRFFAHEQNAVNIEELKRYMAHFSDNLRELDKYKLFDQSVNYTRNVVDEGNGKFNLLVLCWNCNKGSPIHAHAGSHCFMKILDHELREEIFDTPNGVGQEMTLRVSSIHPAGTVAYINDDIGLHKVTNPSDKNGAVSLHLYSPPYTICKVYDNKTGQESDGKMTFYSKNGQKL